MTTAGTLVPSILAALALISFPVHGESVASVSPEVYRHALAVRPPHISELVRNLDVRPVWLPGSDEFWFRKDTVTGWQYVAVDPARRTQRPAFDHPRMAAEIARITGTSVTADHLALHGLSVLDRRARTIAFSAGSRDLICDLPTITCRSTAARAQDPFLLPSPDGRMSAFVRKDNIWLRNLANGQERALTQDGVVHFAYGKRPDSALLSVLQASTGKQFPPYGIHWSPDSRRLIVTRSDERGLPDYHFLQYIPNDGSARPKLIDIRTTLSAESNRAAMEVSIIDVANGVKHPVPTGPDGLIGPYWWSSHSDRFLAIQGNAFFSKALTLFEVKAEDGTLRQVLRESGRTWVQESPIEYDEPAVRYLPTSDEVIWFSQRDGWNHLYLVDLRTGAIKAKLGDGPWSVQNIVRIDERKRLIYFTAVGREKGEDPYLRHLYSAGLDGHGLRLLTPEHGDHLFQSPPNPEIRDALEALGFPTATPQLFSPTGHYFIDTWSTVDSPPVSVVRAADGRLVMPLVSTDISAALQAGWIAPEPFHEKAADGTTDLYGLIFKPAQFDASRQYPVIERIYNGPQEVATPHNFSGALAAGTAESFAQLGFVVVMLDGRGTPLRSKSFQDYMYDNMQEFGLEDHVLVLKALAKRLPFMDLKRLGVIGHSFGGYAAMKGILGYSDFYQAAVASAGPYDMYGAYALDVFFEPPQFAAGSFENREAERRPVNWGNVDLTQQAANLRGKLLLAYGDLDENCYPALAVRMVNALIKANKEFDLVYMPGRSHAFSSEPYFVLRTWNFFVRNLLGAEPPKDFSVGTTP